MLHNLLLQRHACQQHQSQLSITCCEFQRSQCFHLQHITFGCRPRANVTPARIDICKDGSISCWEGMGDVRTSFEHEIYVLHSQTSRIDGRCLSVQLTHKDFCLGSIREADHREGLRLCILKARRIHLLRCRQVNPKLESMNRAFVGSVEVNPMLDARSDEPPLQRTRSHRFCRVSPGLPSICAHPTALLQVRDFVESPMWMHANGDVHRGLIYWSKFVQENERICGFKVPGR
mmetsp:Transcript_37045/g.69017  ORF Transcript_37045/g.69017 Transcript_37045/m.69017 type:complete len:233 (-) Transcript_37045:200-898(-)